VDEVDDEVGRPATDERADDTQRHLNEQTQTIVYTVGQKKRNRFSFVCIFFNTRQKLVIFSLHQGQYKLHFRAFNFGMH